MAVRREFYDLIKLALPAIAAQSLSYTMTVVDQAFVGHLGENELAAAAIGNTIQNLGIFVTIGSTTALDTLGSQAFGRRDARSLLTWTKVSIVFTLLMTIPTTVVLLFASPIARFVLGQDEAVAAATGTFCADLILGCWFLNVSIALQKYLQVQNVMLPPVFLALAANILNVIGNQTFIHWLGMGFRGAPIATTAARIAQCVILWAYVAKYHSTEASVVHLPHTTSPSLGPAPAPSDGDVEMPVLRSFDALASGAPAPATNAFEQVGIPQATESGKGSATDVPSDSSAGTGSTPSLAVPAPGEDAGSDDGVLSAAPFCAVFISPLCVLARALCGRAPAWLTWPRFSRYTRLGLAGGVMLASEVWAFEVTTIMAAHLGTVQVGAHIIQLTLAALSFLTVPFGLSVAATIRVGNLVGAQKPDRAHLVARIALASSCAFQVVIAALFVLFRHDLGALFSSSQRVRDTVAKLAPICAAFQVADAFQGTAGGILRGVGHQLPVARGNLIGHWILGVPAGAVLTFALGVGLVGVWYGLLVGLIAVAGLFAALLVRIDWKHECKRALESSAADHDQTISGPTAGGVAA